MDHCNSIWTCLCPTLTGPPSPHTYFQYNDRICYKVSRSCHSFFKMFQYLLSPCSVYTSHLGLLDMPLIGQNISTLGVCPCLNAVPPGSSPGSPAHFLRSLVKHLLFTETFSFKSSLTIHEMYTSILPTSFTSLTFSSALIIT